MDQDMITKLEQHLTELRAHQARLIEQRQGAITETRATLEAARTAGRTEMIAYLEQSLIKLEKGGQTARSLIDQQITDMEAALAELQRQKMVRR